MILRDMGFGLWRAEQTIRLMRASDGDRGPYTSSFLGNMRIVRAWGRSEDSAALRCRAKAERIEKAHEEWRAARNRRTVIR